MFTKIQSIEDVLVRVESVLVELTAGPWDFRRRRRYIFKVKRLVLRVGLRDRLQTNLLFLQARLFFSLCTNFAGKPFCFRFRLYPGPLFLKTCLSFDAKTRFLFSLS